MDNAHTIFVVGISLYPLRTAECKATFVAWILLSYHLLTSRDKELFRPSKEAKSLLGLI